MIVFMETVRMAKSLPRKNQSERSVLPCHIITGSIIWQGKSNIPQYGPRDRLVTGHYFTEVHWLKKPIFSSQHRTQAQSHDPTLEDSVRKRRESFT